MSLKFKSLIILIVCLLIGFFVIWQATPRCYESVDQAARYSSTGCYARSVFNGTGGAVVMVVLGLATILASAKSHYLMALAMLILSLSIFVARADQASYLSGIKCEGSELGSTGTVVELCEPGISDCMICR